MVCKQAEKGNRSLKVDKRLKHPASATPSGSSAANRDFYITPNVK